MAEKILSSGKDIWCNPLMLENYPAGFFAPSRQEERKEDNKWGFLGDVRDFREMADPEVLYDKGKWYLFVSCSQYMYVSTDLAHWECVPLSFEKDEKLGYAPTITRCGNHYLLSSSFPFAGNKSEILLSAAPEGPYRSLGCPVDGDGEPLCCWLDPMLFTDEDGRLYAYWGFAGAGPGVFGIELDCSNPVRGIGKARKLFDFEPGRRFEHSGESHEMEKNAYVEGASMFKHNGEYYLQYCAGGTQYRSYCVGIYRGKTPLGPFTAQENPAAQKNHGRVCGTGHGCWCKGPEGKVFQFYTALVRHIHIYERRIGMDEVLFDAEGNASVLITDTPRSLTQGDLFLKALSVNKPCITSSECRFCPGSYALDDCTHTAWMPLPEDKKPFLEVDLLEEFFIHSVQIQWAEENLNFRAGICSESVKYKVEFFAEKDHTFVTEVDRSCNEKDLLIDLCELPVLCRARFVKITVLSSGDPGKTVHLGINSFTVFGKGIQGQ